MADILYPIEQETASTFTFGDSSGLRRGITAPLKRVAGDFRTASGAELRRNRVANLLGTGLGELPWEPDYGSRLFLLRHRAFVPALEDMARAFVAEAIDRWEPSLVLTSVRMRERRGPGGHRNVFEVRTAYAAVDAYGRLVDNDEVVNEIEAG